MNRLFAADLCTVVEGFDRFCLRTNDKLRDYLDEAACGIQKMDKEGLSWKLYRIQMWRNPSTSSREVPVFIST